MIKGIKKIKDEINKLTKYRKEHADTFGEVFTEFYLIEEHVSNIDPKLFKDPKSTFLDPCAGFGQYSIILIEKSILKMERFILSSVYNRCSYF